MKPAAMVVRILMGLLFLFGSITFLFHLMPQPELTGVTKTFMEGMMATGYMMQLIKITELVCGLAFVSGFYVPLATIVIAPVIVNIFMFHLFVDTSGLPVALFLVAANSFVAYANWEKYEPILAAK